MSRGGCKLAILIGVCSLPLLTGCSPQDLSSSTALEPHTEGGPPQMRRLTEDQYRQSIADIFGHDIVVGGRFEPELRMNGLLAVGTNEVTITRTGFEQYDTMARAIAAQVLDTEQRGTSVPCTPKSISEPDTACATQFITEIGRKILRRPVSDNILQNKLEMATAATRNTKDFYAGLEYALAGLLVSPEFLFRVDVAVPDVAKPSHSQLDAYSKATRLSFLLWNTTPDDELLDAAESGALDTHDGLTRQVDRLLTSPRIEDGVRTFFSDFLGFEAFDLLEKDPLIYPAFNNRMLVDAKEQTLKVIVDLLVNQHGDYRDLFTTRRTFMTRTLGVAYDLPVRPEQGWEIQEFPEGDPRAGILTHLSFTALYSHPGRSSATLRGKAVREQLLCQPVPPPPNDVNFTIVQETDNPNYRTARERLTAHRENPVCAGCHKIVDPIGLALEKFDGLGQLRTRENGAAIDVSGELDGIDFEDAAGLGQALHDNPKTATCLVNSLYRYAAGRVAQPNEEEWLAYLDDQFARDGYRILDLLRRIAVSDAFYALDDTETSPTLEAFNDG